MLRKLDQKLVRPSVDLFSEPARGQADARLRFSQRASEDREGEDCVVARLER